MCVEKPKNGLSIELKYIYVSNADLTGFFRRRHDNDAENISDISVAPTADEILSERKPYVPRNAPSTWGGMDHLKVISSLASTSGGGINRIRGTIIFFTVLSWRQSV